MSKRIDRYCKISS